jgi:hypothetical protein
MGLFFTIVFLVVSLLSPADIMPVLAPYRVNLVVGILAIFCSIPGLLNNAIWRRLAQSYFWIGMLVAAVLSQLVANHWMGGAVMAADSFFTSAVIMFLIMANCTTVGRLKIVAFCMIAVGLYYTWIGAPDYFGNVLTSKYVLWMRVGPDDGTPKQLLGRLKALSFLSDPNDFAQYLGVSMVFLFLWYKPKHKVQTFVSIFLPMCLLLFGIFLTHSRGMVVALGVLALMTLRRRLGSVAAAVLSGAMALGVIALGATGGRGISSSDGADRLQLWSTGLQLFKSSPIFGVGYNSFTEHSAQTAHNSFVLCFAELGLFGYFFWMGLLVATMFGLNWVMKQLSGQQPVMAAAASVSAGSASLQPSSQSTTFDGDFNEDDSIQREKERKRLMSAARVVHSALIIFLAAAWFLSRAYSMTLYVLLGMAGAIILMAMRREPEREYVDYKKVFQYIIGLQFATVATIYIIVRATNR